ncbi:hypothetical protein GGR52DRAFT_572467 [Hypoxylon sp. FL1284]|nr:hypothetical protein GGR52DRAFT_572467 [Hypoxylon sp. FL1284]
MPVDPRTSQLSHTPNTMTQSVLDAPGGIGAETLAASVVLCVAAILTVGLRLYVRIQIGALGRDDYAMVTALIFFIPSCIVSVLGCLSGFGAPQSTIQEIDPSGGMYRDARKYFSIYWITYMGSLPFVKLSICFALLRITDSKRYVIPLWVILALSVVMSGVGIVTLMTQCKPVSASFNPTPDKCSGGSGTRIGLVTIILSAFSVLTDWLYAAIPAFILWNLNMQAKVKASLAFILALGALASVSTIVRLPYIVGYFFQSDHPLQKTASMIVWSIVETGVGIVAGSLPPLRPLYRGSRFGLGLRGTRRMKLTPEDNATTSRSGEQRRCGSDAPQSNCKRRASDGIHASEDRSSSSHNSVRRPGVARAGHDTALMTRCQGGTPDRAGSWEWRTLEEEDEEESDLAADTPNLKLVIMKNTQIDIEYEAANGTVRSPCK